MKIKDDHTLLLILIPDFYINVILASYMFYLH